MNLTVIVTASGTEVIDMEPVKALVDLVDKCEGGWIEAARALDKRQLEFAFAEVVGLFLGAKTSYDFSLTEEGVASAQKLIEIARSFREAGVILPNWERLLNKDEK